MYSSCPLYFGRHKSKYFYYQITFYMWNIHKNEHHRGWTAKIKRKFMKLRSKIKRKLSFSLPRFYFVIVSLKDHAIFLTYLYTQWIIEWISRSVYLTTQFHFICPYQGILFQEKFLKKDSFLEGMVTKKQRLKGVIFSR